MNFTNEKHQLTWNIVSLVVPISAASIFLPQIFRIIVDVNLGIDKTIYLRAQAANIECKKHFWNTIPKVNAQDFVHAAERIGTLCGAAPEYKADPKETPKTTTYTEQQTITTK